LQTIVAEKEENNAAAILKTERMEDGKVKDLYDRVWGGFSEYTESLKESEDGDDESFWSAAKKYKEENLTSDVDAQFIDLAMAVTEVDYTGGSNELSVFGDTIDDHMGEMISVFVIPFLLTQPDNLTHTLMYLLYDFGNIILTDPLHYMSVPGVGYGNTAANFAATRLVADRVRLASRDTEIGYSNPNSAFISFTKNGVESKVLAKTVLVTVSLGVLKAGNIKFTPSLPDWKREVIDGIGFGLLNKCVMQWNDPNAAVWPNEEWIELITPRGENSGKWTTFFNPTSYKGVPILVGWAAAENARYMETQTDEEVLADVMTKLKAMFPTITTPDCIIITRWGSDENVRGTYSFKKVRRDSFSDDSEQLRMPVKNVWFAGEATAGSWYGTINGAYASGERAANGILEVLSATWYKSLFWWPFSTTV
jgi:hypothetical protein